MKNRKFHMHISTLLYFSMQNRYIDFNKNYIHMANIIFKHNNLKKL